MSFVTIIENVCVAVFVRVCVCVCVCVCLFNCERVGGYAVEEDGH